MRLDLFSKGDTVLLLGEGNFSFSVCLVKQQLPISITATCFEKELSYEQQQANVDYLKSNKVPVFFNVDATKLHINPNFNGKRFSKIIFNFPHAGGKMKIHLNRDLLRKTFESCSRVIEEGGLMIVSLCQGQGGTPADQPQRRYDDSWQIAEMAAFGDFILTEVEPFHDEYFKEYQCVGYRSQDVKFNLKGALVHVFLKSKPFITSFDDAELSEKLDNIPLYEKDTVLAPSIYSVLYRTNPLLDFNSCINFLKELLVKDIIKEESTLECKVLTDNIPVFVKNTNGVPCAVDGITNHYSLRQSSLEIIDNIFEFVKITELDNQIILYPGLFFSANLEGDFTINPVGIEFLLLGKQEDNIICYSQTSKQSVVEVVCKNNNTSESFVLASVHSLEHNGVSFEASILSPISICQCFFKTTNWRQIWAKNRVTLDNKGKPALKHTLIYPSEYQFDITLRFDTETKFSEDKFYKILWLSGGLIINQAELISEYHSEKGWSSRCYRVTYKSFDEPVNRIRIIEFHSKIVGRMLELGMGVTVG